MRRSIPGARRTAALAALAALTALTASAALACTKPASHSVIDAAMTSAHRAAAPALSARSLGEGGPFAVTEARSDEPPLELLAGDMHCHVAPPDEPPHVTRGVPETVELAASEGLDFVVLTPHVGALFLSPPSTGSRRASRPITSRRRTSATATCSATPSTRSTRRRSSWIGRSRRAGGG